MAFLGRNEKIGSKRIGNTMAVLNCKKM